MLTSQKKLVAVVIPIYKNAPDELELISLRRCYEVLGDYPIIFVAPEGLDIAPYLLKHQAEIVYFEKKYFQTVKGYSKLLTHPIFYQTFLAYQYILIHQLDVFIFADELKLWCAKKLDYIGPPWTDDEWMYELAAKWHIPFLPKILRKVGNGGFSLRKVSRFYFFSRLYYFATQRMKLNEDVIWSNHPLSFSPFFRIGNYTQALKFGFEMHPKKCFEENNQQLPFGVHAWQKHDLAFWKPYFEQLGYEIPEKKQSQM